MRGGGVGSRRGVSALSAVCALMALCLPTAQAAPPVAAEKSLLGVRILQTYKDVFRKYGAPNRVYRNGELVQLVEGVDAKGNLTGGIVGLADDMQGGARQAGFPGRGMGMPGFPGMPGAGAYPGMAGGAMNRRMTGGGPPMMRGGMPGYPGMPGAAMGRPGMPGMPGAYPGMAGGAMGRAGKGEEEGGLGPGLSYPGVPGGLPGVPGAGLMNANNPNANQDTFAASGGYVWVYFFPKKQLVYQFFFNADNRVEIIMERGRAYGQSTSRGVHLGSPLRTVYNIYGWPDSLEQQGTSLALYYNQRYHAYFSILNNKVNGIAVFLRENQRILYQGSPQQANNPGMNTGFPGMMRGGMPGRPGFPGAMGRPSFPGGPGAMRGFPGGRMGGPGGGSAK